MIGNEGPTHQLGGPGPIEVVYLKGLRRQLEEAKTEEEIVRIQGLIDAQLAIEASHRRLDQRHAGAMTYESIEMAKLAGPTCGDRPVF